MNTTPTRGAPGGEPPAPAGDPIAHLRARLCEAVRRACPRWLAADADDMVQEAMMRVLDAAGRSGDATAVSPTYLRRAAYSVIVDEIRRRRRRPEDPVDDDDRTVQVRAGQADPERGALASELGIAIGTCLEGLAPARRVAVTLQLQGHSMPEIARLLGWTTRKAEHLFYRGLATLRECLESKGVAP